MKFKSCRWRCDPDDGEFCTHRDVLPFAGKNDFKADSWCPECAFYKLRRTPKKRDWAASAQQLLTRVNSEFDCQCRQFQRNADSNRNFSCSSA